MVSQVSLAARRGASSAPKSFEVHPQHVLQLLFFLMVVNTAFFLFMLSDPRRLGERKAMQEASQACSKESIVKDHTTLLFQRPCQPITVAYAISLVKCADLQSQATRGLLDAALVLRHSLHHTSFHPNSTSNYSYKMYALVHEDAWDCSSVLEDAGFDEVRKVSRPVERDEIGGDGYLRNHIEFEWCCGHDEFIKLYAYTLPEPIVVHVDIDFIFSKPMDEVFDALLYDKDSAIGRAARQRIPSPTQPKQWPDHPQAMMTFDRGQVKPGEKAGYQAGFIVARTNPQVALDMIEIVKKGDFHKVSGWGRKGYGGFVGAMAMQGLVAYYYNEIAPNTFVELNPCRFNHMGRVDPCPDHDKHCEICTKTAFGEIHSIHFNTCGKPWNCRVEVGHGRLDHCKVLHRYWHLVRSKLETELISVSPDEDKTKVTSGAMGSHEKSIFLGHCVADKVYKPLAGGDKEAIARLSQLYNRDTN